MSCAIQINSVQTDPKNGVVDFFSVLFSSSSFLYPRPCPRLEFSRTFLLSPPLCPLTEDPSPVTSPRISDDIYDAMTRSVMLKYVPGGQPYIISENATSEAKRPDVELIAH